MAPCFEQSNNPLHPAAIALTYERTELEVVAEAAPHLVPEGRRRVERGLDRAQERALRFLGAGGQLHELGLEGLGTAVLRESERRSQELLPRGEVVVDERPGDAGLDGDAPDPKRVRTFGHDHAAGSAQYLVDAVARGTRRRLLDPRHPEGTKRTVEVTDYFFGPEASEKEIEELMAWDNQVGEEDVSLVESVQRGLVSGAVPQGRLMEESEQLIADFQRRVRDALLREPI